MREFHIFDMDGDKYIAFAENILYVDNEVIMLMIKNELSSIINTSNIVAFVEILKQHKKEID